MISGKEVKVDLTGIQQTVTFVNQFWKHSNEHENWVPTLVWFLPSDHFQASMFKCIQLTTIQIFSYFEKLTKWLSQEYLTFHVRGLDCHK